MKADENKKKVALVFNANADNRREIASICYDALYGEMLKQRPRLLSMMVHGAFIPRGLDPTDIPDKHKVFVTVETCDLPALKRLVKKKIDMPFEVRPPIF